MNLLFSPNHVHLCNACYPVSSALVNAGPNYSPNSQELSRLTYYASNHPGKLGKLGNELEKRVKADSKKAAVGNVRAKASLLITLNIFKALATECRRDLSLLSPTLISSLQVILASPSSDLEVSAKAASVFTAWATYTNGHLIGADSTMTRNYLSILSTFATLASTDATPQNDQDSRNRARLLGFAALAGALNSDALYNDSAQYKTQVGIVMRPILKVLLHAPVSILDEQIIAVKEAPISPYLSEFRTRPAIERRAASIHVHVDGDKGPSFSDVVNSCLQALNSLLRHATGGQLGYIMQASFECLEELNGWGKADICCWFAEKAVELSQYQYRYAVPTTLVKRLIETQDTTSTTVQQATISSMATAVFNSPTPLINLSTSDIISNLISFMLRCVAIDPKSTLPPIVVKCISSLGRHVYYSDQIQDLSAELIARMNVVKSQGINSSEVDGHRARSVAIALLLQALVGLMQTAERHGELQAKQNATGTHTTIKKSTESSNRSRISPDTWMETLALLYDEDDHIRSCYFVALRFYLLREIPNVTDVAGAHESPSIGTSTTYLREGDSGKKLLDAIHARLYVLATSSLMYEIDAHPSITLTGTEEPVPLLNVLPATPTASSPATENPPSHLPTSNHSSKLPRSRPASHRLSDKAPSSVQLSVTATPIDYGHLLDILCAIHEQLPITGVMTGIPMLVQLNKAAHSGNSPRAFALKEVVSKTWLEIGKLWDCTDLAQHAEKSISSLPQSMSLPRSSHVDFEHFPLRKEDLAFTTFPEEVPSESSFWVPIDNDLALSTLSSNAKVQRATGLDRPTLLRAFSRSWSPDFALGDSTEAGSSVDGSIDEVSPLLKISPALMHIENMSLASLARSSKGVGVTDLREALEGRSSMSNPTLVKPPSISTLDHPSSLLGSDMSNRLTPTTSRTRAKNRPGVMATGTGEVRDVLNRLGIGRQQNGSLLKASFPAIPALQRQKK